MLYVHLHKRTSRSWSLAVPKRSHEDWSNFTSLPHVTGRQVPLTIQLWLDLMRGAPGRLRTSPETTPMREDSNVLC
jgi:hypothetical protein